MSNRTILLLLASLAACSAPQKKAAEQPPQPTATTPAPVEQPVPVEFGRRPPNKPMTSDNMPFFDTVKHCMLTTRQVDTMDKGPAYETCIQIQEHNRLVLAEAIDSHKLEEANIIRCAKASRTAYEGMWYCLNGKPY